MLKSLNLIVALVALAWSTTAFAEVRMSFHSFDGSVLFGRYPHAFVVLEGTTSDGRKVDENFGFTAKHTTTAVLIGMQQQHIACLAAPAAQHTKRERATRCECEARKHEQHGRRTRGTHLQPSATSPTAAPSRRASAPALDGGPR